MATATAAAAVFNAFVTASIAFATSADGLYSGKIDGAGGTGGTGDISGTGGTGGTGGAGGTRSEDACGACVTCELDVDLRGRET